MASNSEELDRVLSLQKAELQDVSFNRQCFFCKKTFVGDIKEFAKHLNLEHHFRLSPVENMVHIKELFQSVEEKLKMKECLFCSDTFPDSQTLNDHMKSFQHRRLPLDSPDYDKYFIRSYIEGEDQDETTSESSVGEDLEEEDKPVEQPDGWDDWGEETQENAICLFCDLSSNVKDIISHMETSHSFKWSLADSLSFYQKIKLVNYIRQCTLCMKCMYCEHAFSDCLEHLCACENGDALPDQKLWDHEKFYCPILENDAFLWSLQENENENENDNDCFNGQE